MQVIVEWETYTEHSLPSLFEEPEAPPVKSSWLDYNTDFEVVEIQEVDPTCGESRINALKQAVAIARKKVHEERYPDKPLSYVVIVDVGLENDSDEWEDDDE